MVQVNSMASKKISNIFKCPLLPTYMIDRSVISVGCSRYIEVTVRNNFIIIPFLFLGKKQNQKMVGIKLQAGLVQISFTFILKPIQ